MIQFAQPIGRATRLRFERETVAARVTDFEQFAQRLQRRIAARKRDGYRRAAAQTFDFGENRGRVHFGPIAFVSRQNRVERVAPRSNENRSRRCARKPSGAR